MSTRPNIVNTCLLLRMIGVSALSHIKHSCFSRGLARGAHLRLRSRPTRHGADSGYSPLSISLRRLSCSKACSDRPLQGRASALPTYNTNNRLSWFRQHQLGVVAQHAQKRNVRLWTPVSEPGVDAAAEEPPKHRPHRVR